MTEKTEKPEKEKKASKPKKAEAPAKKAAVKEEAPAEVHKKEPIAHPTAEAPKPKEAEKPVAAEKPSEQAPKAPRAKKAAKKPKEKAVVARGKRKTAVARAAIRGGKGVIRFNHALLDSYNNPYVREIIREPLRYIGPEANSIDISVNVFGGGTMGQAQAARTAIANALILYFDTMGLKEKFIDIDRSLVVEDTRRVESKKYRGPKARARYQKSYR
jgi:small subunit ribosomal protein S9